MFVRALRFSGKVDSGCTIRFLQADPIQEGDGGKMRPVDGSDRCYLHANFFGVNACLPIQEIIRQIRIIICIIKVKRGKYGEWIID